MSSLGVDLHQQIFILVQGWYLQCIQIEQLTQIQSLAQPWYQWMAQCCCEGHGQALWLAASHHTVASVRSMQVGARGQSPSPLVWRHHMRHTVQNSSFDVAEPRLQNKLPASLDHLTVSPSSEDSWRRICLSKTRLRRLLTLAFMCRI